MSKKVTGVFLVMLMTFAMSSMVFASDIESYIDIEMDFELDFESLTVGTSTYVIYDEDGNQSYVEIVVLPVCPVTFLTLPMPRNWSNTNFFHNITPGTWSVSVSVTAPSRATLSTVVMVEAIRPNPGLATLNLRFIARSDLASPPSGFSLVRTHTNLGATFPFITTEFHSEFAQGNQRVNYRLTTFTEASGSLIRIQGTLQRA